MRVYIPLLFCLLSLILRAESFTVSYVKGIVDRVTEEGDITKRSREIHRLSLNDPINYAQYVASGPNSFCELDSASNLLRIGDQTLIQYLGANIWQILDGSILVCLLSEDITFSLSSLTGKASLTGPCTFIAQTTSNGGYKVITLSGKTNIVIEDKEQTIPSGRLALVLGQSKDIGDGYDIDLLLLLQSSLLINAFDDLPPTFGKIRLAVYKQQLKLKSRYNLVIGDAPTDKNLQMWVMGKEADKK